MNDPLFWVALGAILMSGVGIIVSLFLVRSFGVYSTAFDRERRAADLLSRSNEQVSRELAEISRVNSNVVDLLSRMTGESKESLKPLNAYHPHSDKEIA